MSHHLRRRFIYYIVRKNDEFIHQKPDVRKLTAYAAGAIALLTLSEFFVKITEGTRPALNSGEELISFITSNSTQTLVVIIIDTLLMACLIIFFAGFRQIIIKARRDLNWITDLAFGAGLVFVAVTLVGDAMDAGAALDAAGSYPADASVIRALTEGHMLLFGSIGCVLIALITSTFAYTTFASRAVPRWTAWVGYSVAVTSLLAVPTVFGGTSTTAFGSAAGIGVTLLATFPFLIWVVAVGIVTLKNEPLPKR